VKRAETLWSQGAAPDAQMLAYTVADDRVLDQRLLRWDILGSLGHVVALERGRIVTATEAQRMRRGLRGALKAVATGALVIGQQQEDGHSAVEFWLTRHHGDLGERLHAGRSRNDQVATDVRLFLKDEVLELHRQMLELATRLLEFAGKHRRVLWPGYTHQRRAMPSSAALWAVGHAEGLLNAADGVHGFWAALDRCPLGSAAGYGAPLPLAREAAARALGFSGPDLAATVVQNSRGVLEAAALFWCAEAAHHAARLSSDVILYSAEEFGWLVLPAELSTGSSIMPQKRNPDLFELTRARAGVIEGQLATVLALRRGLPGGYHRDFQFLKAPLLRGLDSARELLTMLATAIPRLGVDAAAARAAMRGDLLATDEVMRRVRQGMPFRRAYREVAAAIKSGAALPEPTTAELLAARTSTGTAGRLPVRALRQRVAEARRWNARISRRFAAAMNALAGRAR
jgi:argininosuccinate lyase